MPRERLHQIKTNLLYLHPVRLFSAFLKDKQNNLDVRPIVTNINQPPLIRSSILNDLIQSETHLKTDTVISTLNTDET
jgi:hypothetical protein